MSFIIFFMFAYMGIGLVMPFLTQALIDKGIKNNNLTIVELILISQFILFITNLITRFFHARLSTTINTHIEISILSDFFTKLMRLPMPFFDSKNIGDLMQRIADHGRLRAFITKDMTNMVFAVVNLILYSLILGYYNSLVLCVFIISQFLCIIWMLCFVKQKRILDSKLFEIESKNQSCIIQLIQGMQEIKLNNDELNKRKEWEELQSIYLSNRLKMLNLEHLKLVGAKTLIYSAELLILFLIAKQVINGQLSLGTLMAISYIMGQINTPTSQYIDFIDSFQNARISIERLNEIHAKKDEYQQRSGIQEIIPVCYDIEFKNVSFSYSGAPYENVLHNLNIKIPQNKIIAIVGKSGSGKTTIMKLLQGFYKPQTGNITVGGDSIDSFNPHIWRGKIGCVMQDGFIFSDTIANNISIGCAEIDSKRLFEAARIANITEYIEQLPLGYNTLIGMEGNGLSQGQKQRILIARAIYKNPDILFFDEATNALDGDNERIIMNNLSEFYKGKTVIISAHRLSTIRNADMIIVIDKGRIIEKGTHQELMTIQGEYFNLVKTQLEQI